MPRDNFFTEHPTWQGMHHVVTGLYTTQILAVAAELGLADVLAGGPKSSAELAQATEADESSLHRLLRVLAAFAVCDEVEPGRFALTPLGAWLRSDIAGSLRPVARFYGGAYAWRSWGGLLHSVRTGEPAGPHTLGITIGTHFAQHPEDLAIFQDAMTTYATVTLSGVVAYDFGGPGTIVDVGEGRARCWLPSCAHIPSSAASCLTPPTWCAVRHPSLRAQAWQSGATLSAGTHWRRSRRAATCTCSHG
jgi:hypothetical protein